METIKKLLKKIDFIGHELKPSIAGNSIIATAIGGCLSIILILTSIAALIFFGQELIMREKPLARTYSRVDATLSQETSKFPIAFGVFSNSGINLSNSEEVRNDFKLYADILSFRINEQGKNLASLKTFPVVLCSSSIVGEEFSNKMTANGFDVNNFFCMDLSSLPPEDRRVSQVNGTPGSNTIRVYFNMCDPAKVKNCGKTYEKYESIYVTASFFDKFIDLKSFSDPIKENMINHTVPVSKKFEAMVRFKINNNVLITDEGYIFSSLDEKTFVSIDNYERNFTDLNEITRTIAILEFQANTKETITERAYLKIQELMANMGGFIKGIMLISKIINTFNADISFINHVKEIEFNVARKNNLNVRFRRNENPVAIKKQSEESNVNIQPENNDELKLIGFCAFLWNYFKCKFKANSTLKQKALLCLELEEMIKQREDVRKLNQRFEEH